MPEYLAPGVYIEEISTDPRPIEGVLAATASAFIEHYHSERNHQGLGNSLIESFGSSRAHSGHIKCREHLSGLLKYYHRNTA